MRISHLRLQNLVQATFSAAGCRPPEDAQIARRLVESNLVGHDSHGVIRVKTYIQWLREGKVHANRQAEIVFQNDCLAVIDGQFGFGQSIGEQAIALGIEKCRRQGVAIVAIRNCGHLGRIGDWAEMAAEAGLASLHWVNTSGLGNLVSPYGGIERRLSANPIAAGVPYAGGRPVILDISTSAVAEGKIRVALNKGVQVPEGCLIDSAGRPLTDPATFYGPPPGAILPFGGHKGYGLSFMAELFAGALTGGGCTDPSVTRLSNGMLSVLMAPEFFANNEVFSADIRRFIDWVKSSRRVPGVDEILIPGEVEDRTRAARQADGIELDANTWSQICETAIAAGLTAERVSELAGADRG